MQKKTTELTKKFLLKILRRKPSEFDSDSKIHSIITSLNPSESFFYNEYVSLNLDNGNPFNFSSNLLNIDSFTNSPNIFEYDSKSWKSHKDSIPENRLSTEHEKEWYEKFFKEHDYLYLREEFLSFISDIDSERKYTEGMLVGVIQYINSEIDTKFSDLLNSKYPNSKSLLKENDSFSIVIDANGLESELKEAQSNIAIQYPYILETIKNNVLDIENFTFSKEIHYIETEPLKKEYATTLMIVGGFSAAKSISTDNIIEDFFELLEPWSILNDKIDFIFEIVSKKILPLSFKLEDSK